MQYFAAGYVLPQNIYFQKSDALFPSPPLESSLQVVLKSNVVYYLLENFPLGKRHFSALKKFEICFRLYL